MVAQAVHSALSQTYRNIEVIVVIDGFDPATEASLSQFRDTRVRVISLREGRGAAGARNAGISAAHGQWIAFLDDDDQWLPEKTERQLAVASNSRHQFPVVSCRFLARTSERNYVWPRRLPANNESLGDYLFSRRTLFQGEGFIATPTIMAPRELLMLVPLNSGLKRHEDWDWMVRVAARKDVAFEFSEEPLALVRMGNNRQGLSSTDDWRFSLNWIRERRVYVSPRAYAAFILTVVADQASRQASLWEYLTLPLESLRNGRPDPFNLLLYVGMGLLPRATRHKLRRGFQRPI